MKFSIITINFNNKGGLLRTVESVIAQLFTDYQFIIIDGGSNDGSIDIVKSFSSKVDKWVSEKDEGIYDAMNKGLLHATGDFVIFLNSGDYFINNQVLEKVNEEISSDPGTDIFYGNVLLVDGINPIGFYKTKTVDPFYLYSEMVYHQAIFARRELFQQYGCFDTSYRICGDYDWILRNFLNGSVATKQIGLTIAGFQVGGVSMTQKRLSKYELSIARRKYFPPFSRLIIDGLRKTKLLKIIGNRGRSGLNGVIKFLSKAKWEKLGLI